MSRIVTLISSLLTVSTQHDKESFLLRTWPSFSIPDLFQIFLLSVEYPGTHLHKQNQNLLSKQENTKLTREA